MSVCERVFVVCVLFAFCTLILILSEQPTMIWHKLKTIGSVMVCLHCYSVSVDIIYFALIVQHRQRVGVYKAIRLYVHTVRHMHIK